MIRIIVLAALLVLFGLYSSFVYTDGTKITGLRDVDRISRSNGHLLFQKYNCSACHQLYGLGGHLGPDLTHSISRNGELYAKAILKTGTQRMPDFRLSDTEIADLISFLTYAGQTSETNLSNAANN